MQLERQTLRRIRHPEPSWVKRVAILWIKAKAEVTA
jgi:hypothetical protein